ncbi:SusD/RagB family nutrient-binding outer membrane lipoprotein [Proteiniphilum sp. UBA5384]|uniref:SusD/RagB family nutrient-binding outer membrane lipoprotein n=1 Tax=Proteiniphilum sp. UBA5384 TaxID=1947279 RepID=UPI0025D3619B|nr:SusD/RagB family nutrient-binding outer membrane lipoprotein [Proteiniphilum sp. UBA5384]
MKQYNFKTVPAIILTSLVILFIISCTGNFEELNLHPANPTEENLTESERLGNLFSSLISTMHYAQENRNQMVDQMIGNQYGGYMVTTNNWQGTNFGTFNPSTDWVDYPFKTIMVDFNSNFIKVKKVTESKGYIYGWASILRVATMLRVTDMYGPIPYSQIGLVESDAIAYDNVKDLYHNMISDLDNSIALLMSYMAEATSKSPMAEFDTVYNGDFEKWLKFANSLKFRMAIRIAEVDTEYAKEIMAEAIAGGPIESNGDNAFIPTEDNPYYKASHLWNDLAASATLSAFMNGYNDPRRPVYMTMATSTGTYQGVRMGINNINKNLYSNNAFFSKPAFTANSPLPVFCAAETAFLKAEAALRGWIPGGDAMAKSYYEQGITLSMEQHGVNIGNYLNGTTSAASYRDMFSGGTVSVATPITIAWSDAGSTQNTKLEKIITQKWLANYPLGFESWCDHRRTGFPQFFPAVNNLSSSGFIGAVTNIPSRMARRLPFPQSQYQGNNENVQKAIQMLGGDDAAYTDLWWAKKQ